MKISRLWVAVIASLVIRYPLVLFFHSSFFLQGKKFTQSWQSLCQWDCPNYAQLSADLVPSAFFPGLPLIAKPMQWLGLSPQASVLLVSWLLTILVGVLTLFFAEEWKNKIFHSESNSRVSTGSFSIYGFAPFSWVFFSLIAVFPHVHFWLRGYSEPLFWGLVLSWALLRLKGYWVLAMLCLSFLPITRPQGIWIWGMVLGFEFWSTRRLIRLLPAFLPFILFLIWNQFEAGSPFYFLKVQVSGWQRGFDWRRGIDAHLPRFVDASLFLYLGLMAGAYFFNRRNKSIVYLFLAIGSWVFAELPLWFGGLYSYNRFSSIHLGLFLFLAEVFVNRRAWFAMWILWSFSRLSMLSYRAGFGHWVESQGTPETELDWLKPAHEKLSYLLSPEVLKKAEAERKEDEVPSTEPSAVPIFSQ